MEKTVNIFQFILAVIVIWINVTSAICWIKHPELSKMEITFRIPKSFVLNFDIIE